MPERIVDWSDLPKELLPCIGKSLKSSSEVLRFRSVCASWRSSIPSFREISPSLPLPFPSPIGQGGEAFVSLTTFYRLELAHENPNPSKGWLIRVEESEPGKLRFLNPLSGRPISAPKVINLLDFRVLEVSKAYKVVKYPSGKSFTAVNKVVLFPNSAWTRAEDCVVFVIYLDGKLGYAKYGDERWTLVDKQYSHYDDIIVYKGQFYVIDRLGTVSWIDSSLKLIQFSPPLCGLGCQKYLVESCGELYVLDRYFDGEPSPRRYRDENIFANLLGSNVYPRTIDFKVYKLDQEWGTWVLVKNLGDTMFILVDDCSFSVSAREFPGSKGNCIYFTDENDFFVFNLGDGSFSKTKYFPDFSHIFRPPPSWRHPNSSSSKC
ncbi:hypothetical protein F2P56_023563 [Juglans regia]|uniref:F-box protein At1g65770 n=2 Tax=Juglans regia TaxID=51240 RepID=A0A2I4GPM9_JUGRE|nr:putative F-box protein At1g65770 [Juglans regia]KAF5453845.1 hypothetical protein F2P56_023563 [Juglans regia]